MKFGLVQVPVADLRRTPSFSLYSYEKDPLLESQLLYNESVKIVKEQDGWIYVEALEQLKFLPSGDWSGYPGWLRKEQVALCQELPRFNLTVRDTVTQLITKEETTQPLPQGTWMEGHSVKAGEWHVILPESEIGKIKSTSVALFSADPTLDAHTRKNIANKAVEFLDSPYLWGGRSAYQPGALTSVDCSGLINLLYRINGIVIPRDAHDQYLVCQKIDGTDLKLADVIFTSSIDNPERITHVILFTGDETIIEASMLAKKVIRTTFSKRFGCSSKDLNSGAVVNNHYLFFGSFSKKDNNLIKVK